MPSAGAIEKVRVSGRWVVPKKGEHEPLPGVRLPHLDQGDLVEPGVLERPAAAHFDDRVPA